MNVPLLTWACIVGLFVIVLLVKIFRPHRAAHPSRKPQRRHLPLLSIGSEREEFFIPGDPMSDNPDRYDLNDPDYL